MADGGQAEIPQSGSSMSSTDKVAQFHKLRGKVEGNLPHAQETLRKKGIQPIEQPRGFLQRLARRVRRGNEPQFGLDTKQYNKATIGIAAELTRKDLDSETDELTGLLNRKGLNKAVLELSERESGSSHHSTVFDADLTGLKAVNDNQGHDIGDKLIQKFAGLLRTNSRVTDILAHQSGDEFRGILVRTNQEQAEVWLKRLNEKMSEAGVNAGVGIAPLIAVEPNNIELAFKEAEKMTNAQKDAYYKAHPEIDRRK